MTPLLLGLVLSVSLAAGSPAAVAPSSPPQRIVGGQTTTIEQYPYTVALLHNSQILTFTQWCGGTVLTSRTVLSAAHCFYTRLGVVHSVAWWRARVGSTLANSGGATHDFDLFVPHPRYVVTTHANNIVSYDSDAVVLRTTTPFVLGDAVATATIAGPAYILPDGASVYAVGWGATAEGGSNSEQLREVEIWTVNQETCRQRYGNAAITDNMLCTGWLDVGGRDQCQGDSGGPLIHKGAGAHVLMGVCSWGSGCARADFPGVNTRVSALSEWIVDAVGRM